MEDIFIKNLPTIDLHGYDTDSARVATTDFLEDNIYLRNSKVVIVHGHGKGLVKKAVHEVLSHHKKVQKYYIDNMNDGMTIAILNIDNQ